MIAGTDGFHGVSRPVVQQGTGGKVWERTYPYAWLGILADAAPATDELIYAWHPEGFALTRCARRRSPGSTCRWTPTRRSRTGPTTGSGTTSRRGSRSTAGSSTTGTITEKSVLPMRSFVSTPMRHGRLFLAGDAAHIVPPTGAKGLNLAVADVTILATALVAAAARRSRPTWSTATPTARWPASGAARTSPGS